jgi:hypothetical protein
MNQLSGAAVWNSWFFLNKLSKVLRKHYKSIHKSINCPEPLFGTIVFFDSESGSRKKLKKRTRKNIKIGLFEILALIAKGGPVCDQRED